MNVEEAINNFIQLDIVDSNKISDGYHTFKELYDHRMALFLFIVDDYPQESWWSYKDHDGTSIDGWIIVGMTLSSGDISYHLPEGYRQYLEHVKMLPCAPEWDGYTSSDVVKRILKTMEIYRDDTTTQ